MMANNKINIADEILKLNENKISMIPNTANPMASNKIDIPDLDEDKILLVADTFSHVEMFIQSGKKRSYARLCAPGLYSFELPDQGSNNIECATNNEEDDHLTDVWTNDECLIELNLINEQDEAQLGVLQRDEVTGEMYMLMPIEVDVLLQPDPSVSVEDLFNEGLTIMASQTGTSSTTTIVGNDENVDAIVDVNVDVASQTTLTELSIDSEPEESEKEQEMEVEVDQVLSERQLCSIVVPKMCLTFDLQLETGSLLENDIETKEN